MFKRAFELLFAVFALILLAPLMTLIAGAVWLGSGRPVFFSHERMGRQFRTFRMYKFRTMLARSSGGAVTIAGDPRITGVGRLLRAWKLDELPQLWNVVKGDMSLVGPRPEVREYVELYRSRYRQILTVRPGISDPASIRFHNEERLLALEVDPMAYYRDVLLPLKIEMAEHYVAHMSPLQDLKILMITLYTVAKPCCTNIVNSMRFLISQPLHESPTRYKGTSKPESQR